MKLILLTLALVSSSAFAAPSQSLSCLQQGIFKMDIEIQSSTAATMTMSGLGDQPNTWTVMCTVPNGATVSTTPAGYEFKGYFYCTDGDQGLSTYDFDSKAMTMIQNGVDTWSCAWN